MGHCLLTRFPHPCSLALRMSHVDTPPPVALHRQLQQTPSGTSYSSSAGARQCSQPSPQPPCMCPLLPVPGPMQVGVGCDAMNYLSGAKRGTSRGTKGSFGPRKDHPRKIPPEAQTEVMPARRKHVHGFHSATAVSIAKLMASRSLIAGAPAPGVAAAAAAAALGPMAASTARGNPPQGPGAAGMASIGGGATRDAVRGDTPTAGGRASGSAAPAGMAAGGGGGGRGSREAPAVSELQKLQPSGNPILEGPSMQRPTTSTTNAHAEQHGSVPQAQQPTNSMQASQERTTGTQCQQQQQQELQQGQHEGSRDGLSKQGPWQQRYRTQVG
jgi:hypothetical protein